MSGLAQARYRVALAGVSLLSASATWGLSGMARAPENSSFGRRMMLGGLSGVSLRLCRKAYST